MTHQRALWRLVSAGFLSFLLVPPQLAPARAAGEQHHIAIEDARVIVGDGQVLEGVDLGAQRGVREVQHLARLDEPALAGHHPEVVQMVVVEPFHVWILWWLSRHVTSTFRNGLQDPDAVEKAHGPEGRRGTHALPPLRDERARRARA